MSSAPTSQPKKAQYGARKFTPSKRLAADWNESQQIKKDELKKLAEATVQFERDLMEKDGMTLEEYRKMVQDNQD
jgi:hypothetical protein